jgi:hypothetical protein
MAIEMKPPQYAGVSRAVGQSGNCAASSRCARAIDICSISERLAEMFKRFFTMATNTYTDPAIQICVFTAFSEVP